MGKPDYIIEAREVSNTIPRQRIRATRLAMERAYNDGHLDGYAAGLKRAIELLPGGQICDPQEIADTIRAEMEKTDV